MTLFKPEDFEAPDMWTNKIGGGGYGIVFKLKELKSGKYYAVKFINSSPQNYGIVLESFLDEVDALNRLDYPTIVHFHGFIPKPISIITEFIPNGNLYDYIYRAYRGDPIAEWDMCHKMIILLGISFGMEYLHEHQTVHRDLKPLNILLDSNFYPKICDFGLSKTLSSSIRFQTYVGTLPYIAPEIKTNNPNYNEKADVYSFGLIMYSLLYDEDLDQNFTYKDLNFDENIISKSFKELIEKCCNNDPEERSTFKVISEKLIEETKKMNEDIDEEGKSKIKEFLKYCHRESTLIKRKGIKEIQNKKAGIRNLKGDISKEEMKKFEEEYNKDEDFKSVKSFSLLHYAAKKNKKEIGEILISKGADINAKAIIYQIIGILFLINII